MAEITAKLVNELRQMTGVGMMDCKKALVETGGDMDAAVDLLRKSGQAKAAKKAGREANEGLIRIHKADDRHAAMLILHSETDFVARNEQFQSLANGLVAHLATVELPPQCIGAVAPPEHNETLLALHYKDGQTISDAITGLIAIIGENMQLGQVVVERSTEPGDYIQDYMHGNRVGVLVCLTVGKPETLHNERFIDAAKDLAMQVAAAMPVAPRSVDREGVDPADVEHEKNILIEQAKAEGKPQEIAEKMVAGRLSKFFAEVCLLEQPYIRDEKLTVKAMLEEVSKELGDTVHVARFHRFQLGS
jgi:elongation factor Ts